MNELQVFNNDIFGEIRTITIDGEPEPWFIGNDIATALGYNNSRKAIADHVDNEDKNTVTIRDGIPGNPNQTVINESGVYSLIFSSELPAAKEFKRWVMHDVLPTIRKQNYYSTYDSDEELIAAIIRNAEDDEKRGLVIRALQEANIDQGTFVTELVGLSDTEISRSATLINRANANLTGKRKLEWWKKSSVRIYTKDDFPERYRKRFYMDGMIERTSKKKDARDWFVHYCGKIYFTIQGYRRVVNVLFRAGDITAEQRDEWAEEAGLL